MRSALYAGSFDLPTLGHKWVVDQAAAMFDKLVVAVAVNPGKKGTFTTSQRMEMVRSIATEHSNVEVVELGPQYTVDYARTHEIGWLVRGLRNTTDFENEQLIRHINALIAPSVTTLFLSPPKALEEVSSSLVKGLVGPSGWRNLVRKFVDSTAHYHLLENYASKQYKSLESFYTRLEEFELVSSRFRGRVYHNIEHVLHCLEELTWVQDQVDPKQYGALLAAVWFHDIVYDPKSPSGFNEVESGRVALLRSMPLSTLQMILATRKHIPVAATASEMWSLYGYSYLDGMGRIDFKSEASPETLSLFLDIDLSILGQQQVDYDRYARAIRQEYSFVSDPAYKEGRTKILNNFLSRDRIYLTDSFESRYGVQARENLTREIAQLGS